MSVKEGDTVSIGMFPRLSVNVTVPSSAVSTIKSGVICCMFLPMVSPREYSDRLKHSAPSAETARDQCIRIMNSLHNDFIYEKNVTDINTDAESAWRAGRGVCQDFAHIYITLLRLAGIPARYVCGLIDGEGESHAWVESLIDGVWTGFDPTNNCEASGTYIKLSIGRDASECAVNRGIVMGGGAQTQLISAQVCEVR